MWPPIDDAGVALGDTAADESLLPLTRVKNAMVFV